MIHVGPLVSETRAALIETNRPAPERTEDATNHRSLADVRHGRLLCYEPVINDLLFFRRPVLAGTGDTVLAGIRRLAVRRARRYYLKEAAVVYFYPYELRISGTGSPTAKLRLHLRILSKRVALWGAGAGYGSAISIPDASRQSVVCHHQISGRPHPL